MAGKARVHELAKELGVTSKEVLARLSEQGEFVKSASSTVEAPVARRLRESFGGAKPAPEKVKADGNGSPAKAAAPPAEGAGAQAGGAAGTAGRTAAPAPPAAVRADQPRLRHPAPAARSAARPVAQRAQARRPDPARRQQPVLLGPAGRPADPAAAGTPSGRPAPRRRTAPRRVARQHATPSGWRWCARASGASRRRPGPLPVVAVPAAVPAAAPAAAVAAV